MKKTPYAIIIRDGWGFNPDYKWNAIYESSTPNHDRYLREYPACLISASGEAVGLPPQNQGSSEVGHLNMGAGRVVYQSLVRITNEIENGNFYQNEDMIQVLEKVKRENSKLHIWGLVQDQGVHSHNDHAKAVLKMAAQKGIPKENILFHVFSDGRDTPPQSAEKYIKDIDEYMKSLNTGSFASITGRYYAMDRDNRWERVQISYDMLAGLKEAPEFNSIYDALQDAYNKDENDEFILPRVTKNFQPVSDNDAVIFFNYRLDRTREITRAFIEDGFNEFNTKDIKNLSYVCFTEYYDNIEKSSRADVRVIFKQIELKNLFGEFLARNNKRQLRIAETEKFAHVTFFFNGQSDVVFDQEDRELIPSPKVATYELKPEMSAYEVKEKAVNHIKSGNYDVIILNFANPDMVGHTGIYDAAKKAVEVVDECVGEVVDAVLGENGTVLLTSDHGNVDQMQDYSTNKPMTSHTSNLVWLHLISSQDHLQKDKVNLQPSGGKLADIIPTLIEIMKMEKPEEMTGISLLQKNTQ